MFGLGTFSQLTFGQLVPFDPDPLAPVSAGGSGRLSAFNFCNPFDHELPFSDGTVSNLDRAHLWGLYSGIAPDSPSVGRIMGGLAGRGGLAGPGGLAGKFGGLAA